MCKHISCTSYALTEDRQLLWCEDCGAVRTTAADQEFPWRRPKAASAIAAHPITVAWLDSLVAFLKGDQRWPDR